MCMACAMFMSIMILGIVAVFVVSLLIHCLRQMGVSRGELAAGQALRLGCPSFMGPGGTRLTGFVSEALFGSSIPKQLS